MSNSNTDFIVPAQSKFTLESVDCRATFPFSNKEEALAHLSKTQKELQELQAKLYAGAQHALLVVFQAMDTGGKDGTINNVFGPLNPQGVRVTSFKAPSSVELSHDYLWRIHKEIPPRGMIGVFNRSHYEDVLIVRVRQWISTEEVKRRYAQINAFESYLVQNNIHLLKVFLHISKDEQKVRLNARIADTSKQWKFDAADVEERRFWEDYQREYEQTMQATSTRQAPWYVVPANRKWARNAIVATLLRDKLASLNLQYPAPKIDLQGVVIE